MPDYSFEIGLTRSGCDPVAGIDEAGRGPLAGPVTAAAVILPINYICPDLNDSKKLSEKKRLHLYEQLISDSQIQYSVCHISAKEIDRINILEATHLAMRNSALSLSHPPFHCLIDGLAVPNFPFPSTAIIKGDQKSMSISAASIIAKVTRDQIMMEFSSKWPHYGFDQHKGYGTKKHLEALKAHGPCPIHRQTFKPVSEISDTAES